MGQPPDPSGQHDASRPAPSAGAVPCPANLTHEQWLEAVRAKWDERLACLQAPDAGESLRRIMQADIRLEGLVSPQGPLA